MQYSSIQYFFQVFTLIMGLMPFSLFAELVIENDMQNAEFYLMDINRQLINAIRNQDMDMIECLLHKGADVHIVDEYGHAALHIAALNNHVEMIQFLIEAGADVKVVLYDMLRYDDSKFLMQVFTMPQVTSVIRGLEVKERENYLQILLLRESDDISITSVIELFEAQFGVRRPQVIREGEVLDSDQNLI